MKVRSMFISLKAAAYAPEVETPKKLYAGELIYCKDIEIPEKGMGNLIIKVKRLIEEEITP